MLLPGWRQAFTHLHERHQEIEEALDLQLEWRENPDLTSSQAILRHDGDWRDATLAPELARWLVHTAETFAANFPKYVQEYRELT